jgi:pimeloyl-ACP methyl ester carboxylesterase
MRAVNFVGIACLVVVLTIFYATDGPMHRWLTFYVWKLSVGKLRGGEYLNVGDVSIYYETYGAGAPVLVLHGGGGSIEGMSYQIRALAKSHFVIAPDSRGHGRSRDSDAPLSYSLMSDDMSKLLDHLQINRADIVGWSDGGIIGLDLAIRYPERIRRLVAISANYDADGIVDSPSDIEVPPAPLRYRFFAPDPAHWPLFYRKLVNMWRTQPRYTLDDLKRIKAPTLILAGEFDIIKREHMAEMTKAISGSREIIVEGATHAVPNDKPEVVNSYILEFLDKAE